MITKWILASLGLFVPVYHKPDVVAAKRRVEVTARWQKRVTSRAVSAALDSIDATQGDERVSQLASATDRTRETMAALLERLK